MVDAPARRETLYPVERALIATSVAVVTCRSHAARRLLVWRLASVIGEIASEPTGTKIADADVPAIRQANDIHFGPLAQVETAAKALLALYRKPAPRDLVAIDAARARLADGVALYFIDRSDAACTALGLLSEPPADFAPEMQATA
ncbi:hypothetical protein LGQ03_07265 [Loktanella sp. TSTF-M6]|uniref:Uncharacterized protein n=1 Tax=Loktanella gaetbuli TaxID=2881335 RepID=A0ABS8BTH9_9RHOB|nr:hypothetical protein [Loktanella gaetbuli]MCB5199035.1 hypothetical protein [Loktanella gaetbuli]